MGDSNIIREGFICSECHAAFSGVEELLKHYEKDHQETTTIKALLGKAKQKFTKDLPQSFSGNPFLPPGSSNSETVSAPPYVYEPQKPGVIIAHTDYFKACRKAKVERYASEGNKLLIRLQKLCDNIPDDPFKRKAHEQSVVSWIDEKAVSRCPECAEQFNMILRRKHHCRLCGSILCDDCSLFLRLDDAKLLTKTLSSHNSNFSQDRNKKRDEISLRICTHCCNILESRRGNYEVSDEGKKLEVLHGQLQEILHRTESLIPELERVVDSLNAGESLYSTQQANSQRADILKLTEKVDMISKKIMTSTGDNSSDVLLRQRIRSSTVISIRNLLVTLPQIPGDEYLAKLKTEAMQGVQFKKTGRAEVVKSGGWVGDLKNVPMVDDPIEQQIINLTEVMDQAQAAGKTDEVEMLAQSIRDLLAYKQANQ